MATEEPVLLKQRQDHLALSELLVDTGEGLESFRERHAKDVRELIHGLQLRSGQIVQSPTRVTGIESPLLGSLQLFGVSVELVVELLEELEGLLRGRGARDAGG